jgi:perosamine synthetase
MHSPTMLFSRFDPTPCSFPLARAPVLPRLHWRSLTLRPGTPKPGARWYSRGRYALADAYRAAGVGSGGALLAPAYHCRSMLDPAVALGAEVILYPLHADLSPDMAALRASMAGASGRIKALLVPHYFGFAQPLAEAKALCSRHGAALVEDCSHVLAGVVEDSGAGPGEAGDYVVSSPYKFFAAPDGGLLWSNGRPLPHRRLAAPRFTDGLRAWRDVLFHGGSESLGNAAPVAPEPEHPLPEPAREWVEVEAAPSTLYDVARQGTASLALSRWITRHTNLQRLAGRRRQHYAQWLAAVEALPGCRPLYPRLPDDCVPYMFPLLLDRPHEPFFALKRLGMPIWRWDEMAVSDCAVSAAYRLGLLHLPCHQELTADDMRWMTGAVRSVLGERSSGGGPGDR